MMVDHVTFESAMSALGWAVVHFLWQGALIGILSAIALACLRGRSAPVRYTVACAAMACSMAAFVVEQKPRD